MTEAQRIRIIRVLVPGIPGPAGGEGRDIRNLGAIEGENDDYIAANDAAFAAAAASGEVWKVPSAGLFLVSKQIVLTSNSGFESSGERPCEILMSSDAGHFDAGPVGAGLPADY